MNVKYLQFSLLVVLLATVFTSLPVRADCDQEDLCRAQSAVSELIDDIVEQRDVIERHWKTLDSPHDRDTVSGWYERTLCLVDVVSRYMLIGTLESRLLVAHNRLVYVKTEMVENDHICHCNDEIQISASY